MVTIFQNDRILIKKVGIYIRLKIKVNLFIYRNCDDKLYEIIDLIENFAKKNKNFEKIINQNFKLVVKLKRKYNLLY